MIIQIKNSRKMNKTEKTRIIMQKKLSRKKKRMKIRVRKKKKKMKKRKK